MVLFLAVRATGFFNARTAAQSRFVLKKKEISATMTVLYVCAGVTAQKGMIVAYENVHLSRSVPSAYAPETS